MRRCILSLLLTVAQFGTVGAEDLSQEDFEFFKEESYGPYRSEVGEDDIEGQFYKIANATSSPDDAIAVFAEALRVPEETAQRYAGALIEAVKFRRVCGEQRDRLSCAFEAGAPLFDAVLDSGFTDVSGRIAISIGKNIPHYGSEPQAAQAAFIRLIVTHSARAAILSELYDYNREIGFAAALVAAEPANVNAAILFRTESQRRSRACASIKNASFLALLDIARQRSREKGDAEARVADLLYTEAMIWAQMWSGLTDEAVHTYRQMPESLHEHVSNAWPSFIARDQRQEYVSENADFASDLAYALFDSDDRQGAESWLAVHEQAANTAMIGSALRVGATALVEAMSPHYSADALYDMYVYGRLTSDLELSGDNQDSNFDRDGRWLFAIERRPAVVKMVIGRRLRNAGYDDLANYLIDDEFQQCEDYQDPIALIEEIMPREFSKRKEFWADQFDAALEQLAARHEQIDEISNSVVYRGTNPLGIDEFNVPQQMLRRNDIQQDDSDESLPKVTIPDNVDLPVNPASVARYAEENGEKLIIYLSTAIDRPGEVPAYGIWFQQTVNGAKEWDVPLYLGLQQYFPYVVVPDSNLPLIADGKLQIEVEVREIDPQSITFPPVGLSIISEKSDIYISIGLDALGRDTDNDGMTDVIEHRLGLHPNNPDTDGDEILDGIDSLPLTAFDPSASPESIEFAFALLETVYGYERAALMVEPSSRSDQENVLDDLGLTSPRISETSTLFLVANPELFSGITLQDRLLVYTESEIRMISGGAAPFYPTQVSQVFSKKNGQEFYVIWSASWVGGEFIVRCREGQCEIEETSSWIT